MPCQIGTRSRCGLHAEQGWAPALSGEYRNDYTVMQHRSRPSHINTVHIWRSATLLTALCGSFPHEYILANSSPAMLRHHLVCCMLSLGTATFKHSSSRPMSRKHSRAAMLVMCALGVFAVLGVDATIIPFSPGSRSTSSSRGQGKFLPFCARKHARAAPAGPAPTIKRSASTVTDPFCSTAGAWPLCLISA